MKNRYCQQCGAIISRNALFCEHCGAKQYIVQSTHDKNSPQHRFIKPHIIRTPSFVYDKVQLNYVDWIMIGTNVINCILAVLITLQTTLVPSSMTTSESNVALFFTIVGLVDSGMDSWENYHNRLPLIVPLLSIIGNAIGLVMYSLIQASYSLLIVPSILGISLLICHHLLHRLYPRP